MANQGRSERSRSPLPSSLSSHSSGARRSENRDFLHSDIAELATEQSNGRLRVIADASLAAAQANPDLFVQVLSTLLTHARTRPADDIATQQQHVTHRENRQKAFVAVTMCKSCGEIGHVHSSCPFDDSVWEAYAAKIHQCRICFSVEHAAAVCRATHLQPRQLLLKQRLQPRLSAPAKPLSVSKPSSAPKIVTAAMVNLTVSTDVKKTAL